MVAQRSLVAGRGGPSSTSPPAPAARPCLLLRMLGPPRPSASQCDPNRQEGHTAQTAFRTGAVTAAEGDGHAGMQEERERQTY